MVSYIHLTKIYIHCSVQQFGGGILEAEIQCQFFPDQWLNSMLGLLRRLSSVLILSIAISPNVTLNLNKFIRDPVQNANNFTEYNRQLLTPVWINQCVIIIIIPDLRNSENRQTKIFQHKADLIREQKNKQFPVSNNPYWKFFSLLKEGRQWQSDQPAKHT